MKQSNKKILIISYYWPPSGGAGVQRWLKISKYLAENNMCFVYTPENPDFSLTDHSLLEKVNPKIKVIKRKIFEPYFLYRALLKKKDRATVNQPSSVDKGGGIIKKMGKWARGNIFIPDPRKFWIKPSARYLKKVIEKQNINVVITTGPPHSMHLIGYRLKKHFKNRINWIADFRDPWTTIDFYDMLQIGKRADNKNKKLEKQVITACNTLVSVSKSWGKVYEELGAKNVKIITNGFDSDDYHQTRELNKTDKFIITHLGSINADRNPLAMWQAIKELNEENEAFKKVFSVRLIGTVHQSVFDSIKKLELTSSVEFIENQPHKMALELLTNSHISLLLLNNVKNIDGIIPGKLFEYIGVGNPIFAIGKKEGDTGVIINENKLGNIADFDDINFIKATLLSFYKRFRDNSLKGVPKEELNKFSIKSISKSFEEIF
ncbi:MAG: glycosyl transferase family 1 [Crocinitomicaceae bacterium]